MDESDVHKESVSFRLANRLVNLLQQYGLCHFLKSMLLTLQHEIIKGEIASLVQSL